MTIPFRSCPRHTIGVEWELQLLDAETLDLTDGIMPLMEFFQDTEFVKPEFVQSSVELNTDICEDSAVATAHLAKTLRALLRRSEELEMYLCGGGTHAFCRRLALITPFPRYQVMERDAGYIAHSQITFSTHVHIGMRSGDQAMRVMCRLIPVLPVFIALSANSPFWRGHRTGHMAYRQRILAAARNYGLPPRFQDWSAFERFLESSRRGKLLETFKDVHWHIRPHPDFGTLELRAMDSASNLTTLHAIAAFARSLMVMLADSDDAEIDGILPASLPDWIEQQNCYNASLHGLDADFVVSANGAFRPLRAVADDLIEFCKPAAQRENEVPGLDLLQAVLDGPPPYQQQLDAYMDGRSARSVVDWLRHQLKEGVHDGSATAK